MRSFRRRALQCHTLYGVGGKIGPDITGANRPNLDYLLENVLDPSAVIPKDYAVTIFEMDNGRKLTGIVKEETEVVTSSPCKPQTNFLFCRRRRLNRAKRATCR